jgi:phosphatidylinositol alpha-1,6-mannosyltransferase
LVVSILQNADRIITISEFTKASILKLGVDCGKIRKVLPGICLDEFHPDVDASNIIDKYNLYGKKGILTIGRLDANEQYKGQDMVIKAMPDILQVVPSAVYVIVGDGSDRERLENMANEVGVSDKVLFTGWIQEAEKPAFYSACDVFAMPSRAIAQNGNVKAEGFGIVYIEANVCGKPVIGGNSGGVPDAVLDGVTGLLVEPNSPKAIGDAIIKLLTNPEMAKRLGENGRKRALSELSAEKMAQNVEAVFEEVG